MKVLNLIGEVDNLYPNSISLKAKIDWLNELETMIYTDIVKDLAQDVQNITRDKDNYIIPGYTIDDIDSLKVNGRLYDKKGVHNYKEGYNYYQDTGGEIKIYPVPSQDIAEGLAITYRKMPKEITEENAAETEISLGTRWISLYRFYLLAQIAYFQKDSADYNNHALRYNAEEMRLRNYVTNKKPDTDKGTRLKNYW